MKSGIFWQSYSSIVLAAKNYLIQAWSLNVLFWVFTSAAVAQSQGTLKVEVFDSSQEALPFANITVYKDNIAKAASITDLDGVAVITQLEADTYNVRITYTGCQTQQINKVPITTDKATCAKINLSMAGTTMQDMLITEYKAPVIDENACTISREDFRKMAYKSVDSVVPCTCCFYNCNRGSLTYVRGTGSSQVFIDGERAIGTPLIGDPVPEIYLPPLLGGLPAQYENAKVGAGPIFPNP